ncbi:hypothetical protein BO86DRAFT_215619 [Aspergillus japonicus CBS 114.51]|uniref:Uncharacterized protein n=1 Tax=Aspergillus japonicus CBS 114.51 TaxID=1448312 RepID=A0A8T8WNZ9_ASPJA|nr:hypothetical protein BO86DRAFT_215619 [Aspergillus japonicus CBS 114.51]RAH77558.1 hypothetical protein BO86DRAFT_215619 [Aspergillus japonicus CBS 114.51]
MSRLFFSVVLITVEERLSCPLTRLNRLHPCGSECTCGKSRFLPSRSPCMVFFLFSTLSILVNCKPRIKHDTEETDAHVLLFCKVNQDRRAFPIAIENVGTWLLGEPGISRRFSQ